MPTLKQIYESDIDRHKLEDIHYTAKLIKNFDKYKNIFPDLSFKELVAYSILFWLAVIYSLFQFYKFSERNKYSLFLIERICIYGTHQDQNDMEWNVFSRVLLECIPYGFLHLVLSQFLRALFSKMLCLFYVIFSCLMLAKLIGIIGMIICLLVPCVMFMMLYSRSKTLIWLTWCLILIGFNTQTFPDFVGQWLIDIQDGEYQMSVMLAWIILRSLSFCLDTCDDDPERNIPNLSLLITLVAYCLYFPLLVTGPYMPYTDFQKGLQKPYESWNMKKVIWFLGQIARFSFWFWVTDTLLYYFYAHSLAFMPGYVSRMNNWALSGFVYFLLVFFLFKYVVYYGMTAIGARAEGYDPPRHPRCVLLVYRISDVWRYFDHGLYRFMIKHIYIPFIRDDRSMLKQLQGSVVVFTFIYIWHGVTPAVFWWTILNFCGVVIEKIGFSISQNENYLFWENKIFPGLWSRRWKAGLGSLVLSLSICSLVIFVSSLQNAQIVVWKLFVNGFPVSTLTLLFLFYCLAQCGMDLENYRRKKKLKEL